ncbi:sugar transferase [Lichenifustis flavocetrariae]|uniref:Sugar transferase n=1 Tax=Lichenifustis flavocetrariae TaxID=2949735 RepID=A0AA41Z1N4_9HYPH|nr:sugar transferase [Lichenifustis flavocetrariae]MCW6511336.1 sugar transferase [Lichenifustis flavocetrariae]
MDIFNINSHSVGRALIIWDCFIAISILIISERLTGQPLLKDVTTTLHLCTFVTLFSVSFFSMGLYRNCYRSPEHVFEKLAAAFAMVVIAMFVLSSVHPAFKTNLTTIFGATFFGCVAVFLTRLVAARFAETERFRRRILVVGDLKTLCALDRLQHAGRTTRFTMFSPGEDSRPVRSDAERLTRLLRTSKARDLVVSDDYQASPGIAAVLLRCRLDGVRVTLMSAFLERETRKLELTDQEAHRLILTSSPHRSIASRLVKRAIDISGSLALLTFTLPLLIVVAIAIKLTDRGPIFYRQARLGLGGRRFMITKFRTMSVESDTGSARWATLNDKRVTRVGHLLRRPRIDELPQLFDVLCGRMSLVGPRPEQVQICDKLSATIPLYDYRHLVLPGLTGWAQINLPYADSLESTIEKTQYDLYYLKNGSIVLDLMILAHTIRTVLFSEGSR